MQMDDVVGSLMRLLETLDTERGRSILGFVIDRACQQSMQAFVQSTIAAGGNTAELASIPLAMMDKVGLLSQVEYATAVCLGNADNVTSAWVTKKECLYRTLRIALFETLWLSKFSGIAHTMFSLQTSATLCKNNSLEAGKNEAPCDHVSL